MFSRIKTYKSTVNYLDNINKLKEKINNADAIVIGAGAGLSTAAGLTYGGERFDLYFSDLKEKYGIRDMYSGGFYPYETLEEYWAFWSRNIYVNRYGEKVNDVYKNLFDLVKDKNYFVITTNVDHQFQKAGFNKERLYYMQGDYGLFQTLSGKVNKTYDNYDTVIKMLLSQNFLKEENGEYVINDKSLWKTTIDSSLVPYHQNGEPLTNNLRIDDSFVQDDGWYKARDNYYKFLEENGHKNILYLEFGIGMNTPVIIKYPFYRFTKENINATYACINLNEAYAPKEIEKQSICIDANIDDVLKQLID